MDDMDCNQSAQQDIVFVCLRGALHRTPTQLSFTDGVQCICGFLFPEAIVYALVVLRNLSLQEAEQVFLSGPDYHYRGRAVFDILEALNLFLKQSEESFGASGVGTDYVSAFVMEGDSVFLNTGFKTNQHVEFVWYFYHTRIAQLIGHTSKICTDVQCKEGKEEFKDRLQLDNQTGSLTISNFRTTDSGDYKLVIITNNITSKIYRIAVNGVPAAQRDEKSVVEGESVILDPGVTKNPNNSVAWYFNDTLIAEITGDQSKICTDDQCSDKFQDRLKLDHQTGSLIITNTRTTDSGLYNLKISSSSSSRYRRHRRHSVDFTRMKSFSVFVTELGYSDSYSDSSRSRVQFLGDSDFHGLGCIFTRT
ncbi:Titin [Labeo rohita]|uniref:Titin n=1 Tax=Labeo rohita TaxID=84645 RepID=A0ABQ8LJ48_LABRO|nr:Titin [Labeo rohita]